MSYTIETTVKENAFIAAYIEAIYFTDTGDMDQPETGAELDADFLRESIVDCLAMFSRIECYLSDDNIEQAGHDFWLTRNHHGVGYWDRPEVYGQWESEMLTQVSQSYGEVFAMFEEVMS